MFCHHPRVHIAVGIAWPDFCCICDAYLCLVVCVTAEREIVSLSEASARTLTGCCADWMGMSPGAASQPGGLLVVTLECHIKL